MGERRWKRDLLVVRAAEYNPAAGARVGWQDDQRQNSQQLGWAALGVREAEEAVVAAVVEGQPSWYNPTAAGTEEQQWTGT